MAAGGAAAAPSLRPMRVAPAAPREAAAQKPEKQQYTSATLRPRSSLPRRPPIHPPQVACARMQSRLRLCDALSVCACRDRRAASARGVRARRPRWPPPARCSAGELSVGVRAADAAAQPTPVAVLATRASRARLRSCCRAVPHVVRTGCHPRRTGSNPKAPKTSARCESARPEAQTRTPAAALGVCWLAQWPGLRTRRMRARAPHCAAWRSQHLGLVLHAVACAPQTLRV